MAALTSVATPTELMVFDHFAESVALFDRDARLRYVNPAFARRLGSCAEAALGRRLWDLSPGTSSNLLSEALRRVIATGSGERLEHADDAWGGRFDSRLYATPAGIY